MQFLPLNLSRQNWSNIFSNIFYAGYFAHNFLEGEIIEGPHEPLVSLEDFQKINRILSKSHNRGYEQKFGLEIKDNMLKLWQLGDLPQKKRVQAMIFPDGLVYDKKNDDIEPLSKNEYMFV